LTRQFRQALDSGAAMSPEMTLAFHTAVKTIMGPDASDFKGNAQGLIAKGLTADDLFEVGRSTYGLNGAANPFSKIIGDDGLETNFRGFRQNGGIMGRGR